MAWERPTLPTLIERVQADAKSRIGKKQMRWSVVTVLCRVFAGAFMALSHLCCDSAFRARQKEFT